VGTEAVGKKKLGIMGLVLSKATSNIIAGKSLLRAKEAGWGKAGAGGMAAAVVAALAPPAPFCTGAPPFPGAGGAGAPRAAAAARPVGRHLHPPAAEPAKDTEWMPERVVKGLPLVGCTVQVLQERSPALPARLSAEPGAAMGAAGAGAAAADGAGGSSGAAPEFVVGVVVEHVAHARYLIQFPNAPAKVTDLGEGAVWMVQRKGRWAPLGLAGEAQLGHQPERLVGRNVRVPFPFPAVGGGGAEQWGVGEVTAHVSGTTFEVAYNQQEVERVDLVLAGQCMLWEPAARRASMGGHRVRV
jgi:hypothetical protein